MGKKLLGLAIIGLAAYGGVEAFKLGKAKWQAKKAIAKAESTTT